MTSTKQPLSTRPDWDSYFLTIAFAVAGRGDCIRARVGAVLVDNNTKYQLASGYNGSEPGGPSCLAGECPRCLSDAPSGSSYEGCIETHAEENVISQYIKHYSPEKVNLSHTTIYITRKPCVQCEPLLRWASVGRVVWPEGYLDLSLPKM